MPSSWHRNGSISERQTTKPTPNAANSKSSTWRRPYVCANWCNIDVFIIAPTLAITIPTGNALSNILVPSADSTGSLSSPHVAKRRRRLETKDAHMQLMKKTCKCCTDMQILNKCKSKCIQCIMQCNQRGCYGKGAPPPLPPPPPMSAATCRPPAPPAARPCNFWVPKNSDDR